MKQRLLLFDITRSFCVIWIVGVWHIFDYVSDEYRYMNLGAITNSVLACFTFMSGFFLGKKEISCMEFYSARFKRFFIPLLVSSILFWFGGAIDSIEQLIFTCTGLSCFIPPQPSTLWYFSMLIVFYLITPLLLWKSANRRMLTLIKSGGAYLTFIILYNMDFIDKRIVIYFPFYVLGILTEREHIIVWIRNNRLNIVILLLWILLLCIPEYYWWWGRYLAIAAFGVYLIFALSYYIERFLSGKVLKKIFSFVAYASMFAYLFHREFYTVIRTIIEKIIHQREFPLVFIPFIVTVLFVVSYLGQKYYDLLLAKVFTKNNK